MMTYNDKAEDLKSNNAAERYPCFITVFSDFNYRQYPDIYSNGQGNIENWDKPEKGCIVTLTDAGAQPNTMMVEAPDATIANIAMDWPWWSEYMTGVAELDWLSQNGMGVERPLGHHQVIALLLGLLELIVEVEVWNETTLLIRWALIHSWNNTGVCCYGLYQAYIRENHASE